MVWSMHTVHHRSFMLPVIITAGIQFSTHTHAVRHHTLALHQQHSGATVHTFLPFVYSKHQLCHTQMQLSAFADNDI